MGCLFCEFIRGEIVEHKKGYPFIVHHQTKNTISFLSLDSPVNKEAHMLVIPKKHFSSFHTIPPRIQSELIEHISSIAGFYSKKKIGYNLLLNNGKEAGQVIPHPHFHIIPRKKNDNVAIEVWKRQKFTGKDFVDLSNATKAEFEQFLKSL